MSYVVPPPVDTSGFVENPMTADLGAGANNINNAGTVTATTGDMTSVVIASLLEHADPTGVIGLYGAAPTPQYPPIADVASGDPEAVAINEILNALRALGVVAV